MPAPKQGTTGGTTSGMNDGMNDAIFANALLYLMGGQDIPSHRLDEHEALVRDLKAVAGIDTAAIEQKPVEEKPAESAGSTE